MAIHNFIRQLKSESQQILKIIHLGLTGMPEMGFQEAEWDNGDESVMPTTLPKLDVDASVSLYSPYVGTIQES